MREICTSGSVGAPEGRPPGLPDRSVWLPEITGPQCVRWRWPSHAEAPPIGPISRKWLRIYIMHPRWSKVPALARIRAGASTRAGRKYPRRSSTGGVASNPRRSSTGGVASNPRWSSTRGVASNPRWSSTRAGAAPALAQVPAPEQYPRWSSTRAGAVPAPEQYPRWRKYPRWSRSLAQYPRRSK